MARTLSAALWGVKPIKIYQIFEPEPNANRLIMANEILATEEFAMLTFELIGLVLLLLFFGALVTGDQHAARH